MGPGIRSHSGGLALSKVCTRTKTTPKSLHVGTINVENFYTNIAYIKQLIQQCDILCVQEHWMYNYQSADMQRELGDVSVAIKCVDDDNPIPPLQRPRGMGGVATIWSSSLDSKVTIVEDGGDRVQAILVQTDQKRTCIVNTYMPCRGKTYSDHDYNSVLDEIYELRQKYLDCDFIWCGDMNASHSRETSSPQDVLFMKFCEEIGVHVPSLMPATSTYHHPNKKDEAQIDYVLLSNSLLKACKSVKVYDREALNTSTHSPVVVDCGMTTAGDVQEKAQAVRNFVKKPAWAKLDEERYCNTLHKRFRTMEEYMDHETPMEVFLGRFYDILTETALELAPPAKIPTKKKPWNRELTTIAKKSKEAFRAWVADGRNSKKSESYIKMRLAKSALRRAQRTLAAQKRRKLVAETMAADASDRVLFYKLIRRQRTGVDRHTSTLTVDGVDLHGEEIGDGWATYFAQLATPSDDEAYDPQHKHNVDLKTLLLADINSRSGDKLPRFNEKDILEVVSQLKAGKALDEYGLSAEHIKYGERPIIPVLTRLINSIVNSGKIPELFKTGLITPVYKKNKKPKDNPDSYRRITITSIIGKILERLFAPIVQEKFADVQSPLQRGFTKGVSCTNAALILSEAINESWDLRMPIWMAMFDASKAFDVVWQDSLLLKLYNTGISGELWTLLKDWYSGQTSSVKWEGERSKSFVEQQGVRQGGILSPDLYKTFINPLLRDLEATSVGFHIGSTYVGVPTCADDMTVIASNPTELQTMVNIAETYANKERYKFNNTKTKVLLKCGNKPVKAALGQETTFVLYDKNLEMVDTQTHLGIDRHTGHPDGVVLPERVKCARRTAYSLMSSGFHGYNGLGTVCNVKMWNTYVIPRLLYGLEVLKLTKSDIKSLENYQTNVMKQLQHLPTRASSAATLLLVGQQPVEAAIDRRILTLFGDAIRTDSVERDLIERQHAMKSRSSSSWVLTVAKILEKYSLPNILPLLETRPSKEHWRQMIKRVTREFWTRKLKKEAKSQTSLKFLNVESLQIGKSHQLWTTVVPEMRDVTRAMVKAKLLTGTYTLQANRAVFNQYEVVKTCPLCGTGPENRQHFVVECPSLQEVRTPYMADIQSLLSASNPEEFIKIWGNNDLCLQLILDSSVSSVSSVVSSDQCRRKLEHITRCMCYALHSERSAILRE